MSNGGDCRTAPATPGLLKSLLFSFTYLKRKIMFISSWIIAYFCIYFNQQNNCILAYSFIFAPWLTCWSSSTQTWQPWQDDRLGSSTKSLSAMLEKSGLRKVLFAASFSKKSVICRHLRREMSHLQLVQVRKGAFEAIMSEIGLFSSHLERESLVRSQFQPKVSLAANPSQKSHQQPCPSQKSH